MCKKSINDTVEKFSSCLKSAIQNKEDALFEKNPSDLMDLAYSELIRINNSLREHENSGAEQENLLNQALELASLAVMIVDQTKGKDTEE